MKRIMCAGALVALAACGAEGDPVTPSLGVGLGIGPGGISLRPKVSVSDGTGRVSVGPGGASVGAGPVSVGL